MSRKIKIPVDFTVHQAGLERMKSEVLKLQNSFDGKFSEEMNKSLKLSISNIESIAERANALSKQEIGIGTYREFHQELMRISNELDKIFKLGSAEIQLKVDNKEVENAKKQIDEVAKQIELVSSDKDSLASRYGSKAAISRTKNEMMNKGIQANFDAESLEDLGLKSISSRIKKQETLNKHVKEQLALYSELAEKEKSGSLSAIDSSKLQILKDEHSTLKKLDALNEGIENAAIEGARLYEKKANEVNKLNIEYERLIKNLKEIRELSGIEDPFGDAANANFGIKQEMKSRNAQVETNFVAEKMDPPEGDINSPLDKNALDGLIAKFFSVQMLINTIKSSIRKTIEIIGGLDKAFVEIAVVTQYTNKEVWGMYGNFQKIAQTSGFTVAEIGKVAGEYFKQGESYSDVLLLTEAAAKAAKVAGIDAADSVNYLTSAVRGYKLAAEDAMLVSDKFAAIAAATATDYDGMATAFSKVAAQANSSGVEFDNLMGIMATAMDVTQEAPENIGTAFKTIFARMSEIKDYGAVLEDGIDANRIEKALKIVNVSLFDQNREMRALDDVLLEVGARWKGLNSSQKAYLATSLAGTRQQTRLLAVFENYDQTLKNIDVSRRAAGATEAQQLKNSSSIEHAVNRINVAFESLITAAVGNEAVILTVKLLANALETLSNILDSFPGKVVLVTATVATLTSSFKSLQDAAKKSKELEILFGIFKNGWGNIKTSSSAVLDFSKSLLGSLPVFKNFIKKGVETKAAVEGATVATNALTASTVLMNAAVGIGAVAAIFALGVAIKKFTDQEAQIAGINKRIKELNAELYNIQENKNSFESLVEEYKTLERQAFKTSEEFERMSEIIKLLNDLDLKGTINFDLNGKLDENAVNQFADKIAKEEGKNFRDRISAGMKFRNKNKKKLSGENVSSLNSAFMISSITGYENREKARETAIKYRVKGQTVESINKTFDNMTGFADFEKFNKLSESVKEIIKTLSAADPDLIEEIFLSMKPEESVKLLEAMPAALDTVNESTMSIGQAQEYLKQTSGELYDVWAQSDGTVKLIDQWKDLDNVTLQGLKNMTAAVDSASKFNIKLSADQVELLAKALNDSSDGAAAFSVAIMDMARNSEASLSDTIGFMSNLIDVFDELTEDQLLNMMQTFDSIDDRLSKFNDSLDNFNTESLRELIHLINEYPDQASLMIESIEKTGKVSEDVQKQMLAAEKDRVKKSIEAEILQNETRIRILEAKKEAYANILGDEEALRDMAAKASFDIQNLTGENIINHLGAQGKAYEHHFAQIIKLSQEAGAAMAQGLANENITVGLSGYRGGEGYEGKFEGEQFDKRLEVIKNSLNNSIESTNSQIKILTETNNALRLSLGSLDNDTWNKSLSETAKEAKKAGKELKIYEGLLNKIYVAQKRLEAVDMGLNLIKAQRAYEESARAVKGLAGAKDSLRSQSVADTIGDEYDSLELYKEQLKNIIEVSGEYQSKLQSELNPALKSSYKIINGQVYPVADKYKQLTYEQMKEVDEFAKSFNELGKEVYGYKNELYGAEQAQNDLIAGMRDRVIEFQELMIDTIKNQEKKQIDSFKKIIDANKKYLEERKKLYESSFEEEDNEKESSSIQEQRLAVIEKLAALEAAHDVTSMQRKSEYRKQLQDLDDQFNLLMLERNREALLESLDNQITYQEDIYQKEEQAYNDRIESAEWLEERMKQIQDEARVQAILDNMGHHWTLQQMLENGYITQKEITKLGVEDMNKTVNDLNNEQKKVLEEYWGNNRDIIDDMWNATEGKVGAKKLSEDAMSHILDYLVAHSTAMVGQTSTMKEKITTEWKSLLTDVASYTKSFNAIELKAPNTSKVTSGLNSALSSIKTTTNNIALEFKRVVTEAEKTAAAVGKAMGKITSNAGGGKTTYTISPGSKSTQHSEWKIKGTDGSEHSYVIAIGGVRTLDGTKITKADLEKRFGIKAPMKTGGTTDRTGLHWLDGSPGAPERVLSAGANARFEELLGSLKAESEVRVEDRYSQEVVEGLNKVIAAIYDTEIDMDPLAQALNKKSGNGLIDIINAKGISTNRRG